MHLPTAIGRWPTSSIAPWVGRRPVVSWSHDDCFRKRRPAHTLRSGPLRLSRLGHEPVLDSRWHLALLRWTRRHGTAHRRVAGRLRAAKNPHPFFRGQSLYLEIIRLAYNLVTAFQRQCLQESWQNLTLAKLRYKLFLLPGELTRPQNRPVLRLSESPLLRDLATDILTKRSEEHTSELQ